jgi:hypothetical protein
LFALHTTAVRHQLAVSTRQIQSLGDTGDALLFPGAPMNYTADGHPNPLPEELAAAVGRATDRTLNALHSLRTAVREHVQSERSRGTSLRQVNAEIRAMINTVASDSVHPEYSPERHDELTAQVLKWTDSFYDRKGTPI